MTTLKSWRALFVGALAAAIGLGLGGEVLAQAPPPTSPERLAMGTEFAQDMFQSVDLGVSVVKGMGDMSSTFGEVKDRPDWSELFKQSAIEEVNQDRPKINHYLGKLFADYFTEGELRVALKMMHGPAGPDLSRIISASANGEQPPPLSPEGQRAIEQLAREPDAQSFFRKFGKIEDVMKPFEDAIVPMILPGIFKRFGEKAQAEEDARAAAGG